MNAHARLRTVCRIFSGMLLMLVLPVSAQPALLQGARLSLPMTPEASIVFELQRQEVAGAPHLQRVLGQGPGGARLIAFVRNGKDVLSADAFTPRGHYRWRVGHWQRSNPGTWPLAREVPDWVAPSVPAASASAAPMAEPAADGTYQIDILGLITPAVLEIYGSRAAATDEVRRQIEFANVLFENSGVPVRYAVIDVQVYSGTREYVDGHRNLNVISRDGAIAKWRDALAADLVLLFRSPDGDASVAVARLFNGNDKNDPPQDVNPNRDAYAIVYAGESKAGYTVPYWVTAHEMGHLLGAGHNWAAHKADGLYWQSDAHGFDCGNAGNGPYASIMSYGAVASLVGVTVGGTTYGDFFSSPHIERDGMPCGMAAHDGPEPAQADNVRVITRAAPYVAAYRDANHAQARAAQPDAAAGGMGGMWLLVALLGAARRCRFRKRLR